VNANQGCWREPVAAEFYVDFETVSDLNDDFTAFPEAGGQPLIFMIGCAQMSADSQWHHRFFTARSLTLPVARLGGSIFPDAAHKCLLGAGGPRVSAACRGYTRRRHPPIQLSGAFSGLPGRSQLRPVPRRAA
jgi:hypothetical protein